MTCDLVKEVGDMKGLNGRPTGNAGLKIWARPPTSPSGAHLPLTTAMPSSPARSPSAQSTVRHGTAHETLPLPSLSLYSPALCEMHLLLPGLEKAARGAVLDDLPEPRRPIG
jgi:hypothetical protein